MENISAISNIADADHPGAVEGTMNPIESLTSGNIRRILLILASSTFVGCAVAHANSPEQQRKAWEDYDPNDTIAQADAKELSAEYLDITHKLQDGGQSLTESDWDHIEGLMRTLARIDAAVSPPYAFSNLHRYAGYVILSQLNHDQRQIIIDKMKDDRVFLQLVVNLTATNYLTVDQGVRLMRDAQKRHPDTDFDYDGEVSVLSSGGMSRYKTDLAKIQVQAEMDRSALGTQAKTNGKIYSPYCFSSHEAALECGLKDTSIPYCFSSHEAAFQCGVGEILLVVGGAYVAGELASSVNPGTFNGMSTSTASEPRPTSEPKHYSVTGKGFDSRHPTFRTFTITCGDGSTEYIVEAIYDDKKIHYCDNGNSAEWTNWASFGSFEDCRDSFDAQATQQCNE